MSRYTVLNVNIRTVIKWGRLYSEEINQIQNNLLNNVFAEGIVGHEYALVISIQDRRIRAKEGI